MLAGFREEMPPTPLRQRDGDLEPSLRSWQGGDWPEQVTEVQADAAVRLVHAVRAEVAVLWTVPWRTLRVTPPSFPLPLLLILVALMDVQLRGMAMAEGRVLEERTTRWWDGSNASPAASGGRSPPGLR